MVWRLPPRGRTSSHGKSWGHSIFMDKGPCRRVLCSIRFPKRAFFARLFLQISVVDQVGGVVRFETVDVTDLMLMFDFAAGDFFGEFVSVIGNKAVEALAVKFSLLHPNLLFAVGTKFEVHALLHVVAAVREETETPPALFLAREGGVADVNVSQVAPAVAVVAVVRIRRIQAHPGIVVSWRVGDAEADGLTVIEGQDLKGR